MRLQYVHEDTDPGENPSWILVRERIQQPWEESKEEEESPRSAEESEQPRWRSGGHKEGKDKEDNGKEEEEDRDGEGTLSRRATPGRSHQGKKGRNQTQQIHTAHKASTNFLQEPRANQANETKEAP